ncbi:MAG: hypothetical protein WAT92_08225 [Saprospiraceae bacterium]
MKILLLTLFLTANVITYGQFTPEQIKQLDAIATQDVPKNAPGIATGIVIDGRVVYEHVAGFANLTDSTLITKDS